MKINQNINNNKAKILLKIKNYLISKKIKFRKIIKVNQKILKKHQVNKKASCDKIVNYPKKGIN